MFKKILSLILAMLLTLSFAGCKKQQSTDNVNVDEVHKETEQKIDEFNWKEEDYSLVKLDNKVFKSENKNIDYKDGDVAITKGGTYVLKGYYYGGIVVDTTDEVNLVFNTVQLFPSGEPAIKIENAKKVNIVLQEDTINTITDKTIYENETGTISSNSDLFFIGGGALFIESNSTAIMCEENVTFGDSTINIVAGLNGVFSKKCIHFIEGSIGVYCGENAITSIQHIEVNKGYVQVKKAKEGLESLNIDILDGTVEIVSDDDGINGTDKLEKNSNAVLNIKGGKITVNAGGDGIDVNGEIVMSDGIVFVYGTDNKDDGMIDFDKTFEFKGGTLICAGYPHMLQKVTTSKEPTLFVGDIRFPENSIVEITDSKNKELFEIKNPWGFTTFYMVSDQLKDGGTYNLVSEGKTINNLTATRQ
ncbi:MAG: carbohydrate-binding domain-containing protein [Clostridia bacterium]|nr:carbohydrate-binding domain-containing protein [Clostridia bacterium]